MRVAAPWIEKFRKSNRFWKAYLSDASENNKAIHSHGNDPLLVSELEVEQLQDENCSEFDIESKLIRIEVQPIARVSLSAQSQRVTATPKLVKLHRLPSGDNHAARPYTRCVPQSGGDTATAIVPHHLGRSVTTPAAIPAAMSSVDSRLVESDHDDDIALDDDFELPGDASLPPHNRKRRKHVLSPELVEKPTDFYCQHCGLHRPSKFSLSNHLRFCTKRTRPEPELIEYIFTPGSIFECQLIYTLDDRQLFRRNNNSPSSLRYICYRAGCRATLRLANGVVTRHGGSHKHADQEMKYRKFKFEHRIKLRSIEEMGLISTKEIFEQELAEYVFLWRCARFV